MDGTRPTEPDGTESVGTEPKLSGDGTEIMWGRNQNYVGPIPLFLFFEAKITQAVHIPLSHSLPSILLSLPHPIAADGCEVEQILHASSCHLAVDLASEGRHHGVGRWL